MLKFIGYLIVIMFNYGALVMLDFVIAKADFVNIQEEYANKMLRSKGKEQEAKMDDLENGYVNGLAPWMIDGQAKSLRRYLSPVKESNVLPMGTFLNANISYCEEGFGQIRFKSDRFGFRNPDENWDNIDDLQVLLLGDSYGQGACVEHTDSIQHLIDEAYGKTLSLSIGGNNAAQYYAYSKVFLPKLSPKYVILLFYANDSYENLDSYYLNDEKLRSENYFAKDKMEPSENLKSLYSKLDAEVFSLLTSNQIPAQSNFSDLFAVLIHKGRKYLRLSHLTAFMKSLIFENYYEITNKAIETTKIMCELRSCEPIIVFLANSSNWDPSNDSIEYENFLKKISTQNSLLFLSNRDLVTQYGDEFFAPYGSHYSPMGYRETSKLIIQSMN